MTLGGTCCKIIRMKLHGGEFELLMYRVFSPASERAMIVLVDTATALTVSIRARAARDLGGIPRATIDATRDGLRLIATSRH
jgi:hypothetical protein